MSETEFARAERNWRDLCRTEKERDRWQAECGKLTAEVARLRALLQEWFDDDYDGAELLIRTGKALEGSGE